MYYIDFHCHILPGVDDGSQNCETSVKMISTAYKNGTRAFVLTPHYKHGYFGFTSDEIKERFNDFKAKVKELFPDVLLFLGTEILYDSSTVQNIIDNKALTIEGTRNVLVEFQPLTPLSYILGAVEALTCRGFIPIIAHIERYECIRKKIDEVEHLINLGCYIQVNADSISGGNGHKIKSFCSKIIDNGWVHLIGSDAHNDDKRNADLSSATYKLEKNYSAQFLKGLFYENAKKILTEGRK